MKLLIEETHDIQYLTEETNGKKNLYFEGVFMQAEIKNRNGRLYPKETMLKEMTRYVNERVDARCAWGELGHPAVPTINHERVSHRIVSLRMEGNDVIGKAIITETPMGLIAKGLIESGGSFGSSSRALGSVKNKGGINIVQEDFRLSTAADIVDDASAPGARSMRALMENTDWFIDAFGNWAPRQQIIEDTVREAKGLSRSQLEENAVKLMDRFLVNMIQLPK